MYVYHIAYVSCYNLWLIIWWWPNILCHLCDHITFVANRKIVAGFPSIIYMIEDYIGSTWCDWENGMCLKLTKSENVSSFYPTFVTYQWLSAVITALHPWDIFWYTSYCFSQCQLSFCWVFILSSITHNMATFVYCI